MMTKQSSFVLCFATSSTLNVWSPPAFLAGASPLAATRASGSDPATRRSPSAGSMPSLPPAAGLTCADEVGAGEDEEPLVVSMVMREPGAMVIVACGGSARTEAQRQRGLLNLEGGGGVSKARTCIIWPAIALRRSLARCEL